MKFVVYAFMLAVCAQAAAAQESTGDRVRYRLEGESQWQKGFFQSISAHGLVFTADETAPLDTLPLNTLNAVDLHRGNHVSGSRVLFFTVVGFFAGGLIGAAATQSDCTQECWPNLGPTLVGAGVGLGVGLSFGLIPLTEWERVHGEPTQRRSNPWSSGGAEMRLRF